MKNEQREIGQTHLGGLCTSSSFNVKDIRKCLKFSKTYFPPEKGREVERWNRWRHKGEMNNVAPVEILLLVDFHITAVVFFFLSLFMSAIISPSAWKEAWRIAGALGLRASTSEGPEENKERIANLIIISHLFRELMWCLRCQAVLFLSHSALLLPSLIPHPSSLPLSLSFFFSLTLIASFLFALCRRSALTRGALMKAFQSRIWLSEMSFSDQMSLKQGMSYHLVRSTSLAFCSVSRQLSQTQSLSEITCGFLVVVFSPLIFYKENYPTHWK